MARRGGARYPLGPQFGHRADPPGPERPATVVTPRTAALPSPTAGRELRAAIRSAVVRGGASQNRAQDLTLAAWEALLNAVEHGGGRPTITIGAADDRVTVRITDRGRRPGGPTPNGRSTVASDPRAARGRGQRIMDALVDEVQIIDAEDGVHLELTIRLPG